MTLPIERFKESYVNRRHNPFTDADMAIDKEEDHLFIPGGAPYTIQLLEQPRLNDPTSITVYCYDDVAFLTEVAGAPAQGEFRTDYPPDDGEGTGLVEFNNLDAGKEVRFNYKATGSPVLAEFSDTKVSYPAGDPVDNQIIAFDTGAPTWKYNPKPYFHEGSVIYNAAGEDESCLLFRFKRRAEDQKVYLELKGAKLHQGFYSELAAHTHGIGTYDAAAAPTHNHSLSGLTIAQGGDHGHAIGTLAVVAAAAHSHAKGTLVNAGAADHLHAKGTIATQNGGVAHTHPFGTLAVGSESAHTHTKGTLAAVAVGTHTHGFGTLVNAAAANHTHAFGDLVGSQPTHQHGDGTLAGTQGTHIHTITGDSAQYDGTHTHPAGSLVSPTHNHTITGRSHLHASEVPTGGNDTGVADGCATPTGNKIVTITGSTGGRSDPNLHRHGVGN